MDEMFAKFEDDEKWQPLPVSVILFTHGVLKKTCFVCLAFV